MLLVCGVYAVSSTFVCVCVRVCECGCCRPYGMWLLGRVFYLCVCLSVYIWFDVWCVYA